MAETQSSPAPKLTPAPPTRLRNRRSYVGLTLDQLAGRAELSLRTVYNAEHRVGAMRIATQLKLLEGLELGEEARHDYFDHKTGKAK